MPERLPGVRQCGVPSTRRPSCSRARRARERGILHGLSLVVITLLLFGGIAYFALGSFPLRCACKDGTVQKGTRGGFDSPEKKCAQVCAARGGGGPVMRGAAKGGKEQAR